MSRGLSGFGKFRKELGGRSLTSRFNLLSALSSAALLTGNILLPEKILAVAFPKRPRPAVLGLNSGLPFYEEPGLFGNTFAKAPFKENNVSGFSLFVEEKPKFEADFSSLFSPYFLSSDPESRRL